MNTKSNRHFVLRSEFLLQIESITKIVYFSARVSALSYFSRQIKFLFYIINLYESLKIVVKKFVKSIVQSKNVNKLGQFDGKKAMKIKKTKLNGYFWNFMKSNTITHVEQSYCATCLRNAEFWHFWKTNEDMTKYDEILNAEPHCAKANAKHNKNFCFW